MIAGHDTVWEDIIELAAIAAKPIAHKYRDWVEFDDLKQSACEYALRRKDKVEEYLFEVDDDGKLQRRGEGSVRQGETAMITFLRRHLERIARKEKATRSGYSTEDEYFYRATTVESLIKVWGSGDYDVAGQVLDPTDMGGKRAKKLASEGNNLLAMISDVDAAMKRIDDRVRTVLIERFVYDMTLHQIADELGVSVQRVEQLSARGIRKVIEELGGPNPWGGE